MIHERLPQVAQNVVDGLEGAQEVGGCIGELRAISLGLDRQGFVGRPTWTLLKFGTQPPPADFFELGEWAHGWQYFASSVTEYHYRKTPVLRQSCPSHQAHLRSLSGRRMFRCAARLPDERRIRSGTGTFPNLDLGEIKVATCRGGCCQ